MKDREREREKREREKRESHRLKKMLRGQRHVLQEKRATGGERWFSGRRKKEGHE